MRIPLYNLNGKLIQAKFQKYRIKWDGKSPSEPQQKTKEFLKKYWYGQIVCEEFRLPGTLLRIDFINFTKRIVVETHGPQHYTFVKHFHRNKAGYLASFRRDQAKAKFIEINNFAFLEILDSEIDLLSKEYILEKYGIEV